ncbi:MAG: serine hydrolase [Cyclobacteriaceae bacterium]
MTPKTLKISLLIVMCVMAYWPNTTHAQNTLDSLNTEERFEISDSLLRQLDSRISQIVHEGIDSMAFPGCQILIAKDGQTFYRKSFGFHTYSQKQKVKNTDLYDLASITKVAGSTLALMKLYDEGKIQLDESFSAYWADFNGNNKSEMTMREVLAHNARLKSYIPYYAEMKKKNGSFKWRSVRTDSSRRFPTRISSTQFLYKDFKVKRIYKMIKKSKLNQNPGYLYSGLSFYLIPEIVSNLTGQRFENYLKDNFYKPLGASTLCFKAGEKYPLQRIVPTEDDDYFRNQLLHGIVHDEGAAMMDGISGNAGLFSTAEDLAKVFQMLLNKGELQGKQYLSPETIDEFTRCQYCDQENRRGLGFDKPLIEYDSIKSSVAKMASHMSYGHSGYTGTIVWADPENQLLYIFLSNRVHPSRSNRNLYDMNIRPRIHNVIYELIK